MNEEDLNYIKALQAKLDRKSIMKPNDSNTSAIIDLAEIISHNMTLMNGIEVDKYVELMKESSEISTLASLFVETYTQGLDEIENLELEVTSEEKDNMIMQTLATSTLVSVIPGILEIVALRRVAKEALEEAEHYKFLLELVTEEQVQELTEEEKENASRRHPEKKTIQ